MTKLGANTRSKKVQIHLENLTSGGSAKNQQDQKIVLQEINEQPLRLTLNAPASACATGHHLKVLIQVSDTPHPVKFSATGVAREVETMHDSIRIVFQPVQYDKMEWSL